MVIVEELESLKNLPVYRARLGKDPLPQLFSEELTGSTLLPFAPKSK